MLVQSFRKFVWDDSRYAYAPVSGPDARIPFDGLTY